MSVATGLAIGSQPKPELAQRAVSEAMQTAGLEVANSVLLFLTSEFARDPMPALKAAGKTASCVQVVGCSAAGIFTEQDWVLDAPAAAVDINRLCWPIGSVFAATRLVVPASSTRTCSVPAGVVSML